MKSKYSWRYIINIFSCFSPMVKWFLMLFKEWRTQNHFRKNFWLLCSACGQIVAYRLATHVQTSTSSTILLNSKYFTTFMLNRLYNRRTDVIYRELKPAKQNKTRQWSHAFCLILDSSYLLLNFIISSIIIHNFVSIKFLSKWWILKPLSYINDKMYASCL